MVAEREDKFFRRTEELREADINLLINVIRRKHMISMDTAEHTDNSIQKMLDLIEHFESNASSPVSRLCDSIW
jgi:hypothetical protein